MLNDENSKITNQINEATQPGQPEQPAQIVEESVIPDNFLQYKISRDKLTLYEATPLEAFSIGRYLETSIESIMLFSVVIAISAILGFFFTAWISVIIIALILNTILFLPLLIRLPSKKRLIRGKVVRSYFNKRNQALIDVWIPSTEQYCEGIFVMKEESGRCVRNMDVVIMNVRGSRPHAISESHFQ
ncbi:MAG TPA: hypothetical protein PKV44_07550 [Bacillota bacterium]|jgi:hypothetical protein|nr:hypothetical protein [Bacillota bacterium]HPE38133.1 hypothetical protein [Bacillota bacterium]